MNNTLNPRIKRLIKESLLDYAKVLGVFFSIGLIIGLILLALLTMAFITDEPFAVDISFIMIGLSSLVVTMFIAGVVTGAELPMHVRQGVARNEYFKATFIAAVMVSTLLLPVNWLIRVIADGVNVTDSLRSDYLLILVIYALIFMTAYLLGHFIAMVYQRFGWMIGVCVTILILMVLGVISWHSNTIILIPDLLPLIYEGYDSITYLIAPELLGPILIIILVILAKGTYAFVKHIPVKVK